MHHELVDADSADDPVPSPSANTAPTKTSATLYSTCPPSPNHVDPVAPDTHVLPILLPCLFSLRYPINDDPANLRKIALLNPDSTPRPPAVVPVIQSTESAKSDSATLPTLVLSLPAPRSSLSVRSAKAPPAPSGSPKTRLVHRCPPAYPASTRIRSAVTSPAPHPSALSFGTPHDRTIHPTESYRSHQHPCPSSLSRSSSAIATATAPASSSFASRNLLRTFPSSVHLLTSTQQHIAHANITTLLSDYTTPTTHHTLILPHLAGTDFLSLVNTDADLSAGSGMSSAAASRGCTPLASSTAKSSSRVCPLLTPSSRPPPDILLLTPPTPPRSSNSPISASPGSSTPTLHSPTPAAAPRPSPHRTTTTTPARPTPGPAASSSLPCASAGCRLGMHLSAKGSAGGGWSESPGGRLESEPEGSGGLKGEGLVRCQGAKRMVGRLLVHDLVCRATLRELWTDEWICGEPIQGRLVDN